MIQRGNGAGVAPEPLERKLVVRHIIRQEFRAAEARVFRLINHAHSAPAEFLGVAIVRDLRAEIKKRNRVELLLRLVEFEINSIRIYHEYISRDGPKLYDLAARRNHLCADAK